MTDLKTPELQGPALPARQTGTAGPGPGPHRARRTIPWATGAAAGCVLLVLAYALLVPLLAPAPLHDVDLQAARQAPGAQHLFGTDNLGHDLFVRVASGLRVSLGIAVACAVLSSVAGLAIGAVAALAGGLVDAILMRFADTLSALPHLLLGIVIVAMYRGSVAAIIFSIAFTHWCGIARLVRSVALTTRSMEYVDSAYLAGARRREVLSQHLLPAALGQAFIGIVLLLPHAIWHESALSFLGLGLSPDQPSLGTLLAQSRGEILLGGWWTLVFPAALLVLVTVASSALVGAAQRRWAPDADAHEVMS